MLGHKQAQNMFHVAAGLLVKQVLEVIRAWKVLEALIYVLCLFARLR